jgi:hypothetical protein
LTQFVDININTNARRIDISEEFNDESLITVPKTLRQLFTIVPSKLRFVTLIAFLVKIFNNAVRSRQAIEHARYLPSIRFVKRKNDAKVLLFLATNELVRFHCDVLNVILNGEQDDDPDEQSTELQFGHLLNDNVKLLRLQGDMTHQVRSRARDENSGYVHV